MLTTTDELREKQSEMVLRWKFRSRLARRILRAITADTGRRWGKCSRVAATVGCCRASVQRVITEMGKGRV
jgi:hypothetical protein